MLFSQSMRIFCLEQENHTEVMGVVHARIHALSYKAIRLLSHRTALGAYLLLESACDTRHQQ
jgi:hypothetical protein